MSQSSTSAILVRLYHATNFLTLSSGAYVWVRVFNQWRYCYAKASPVIKSYVFLSAADLLTLINYLCTSITGLTTGRLASKY